MRRKGYSFFDFLKSENGRKISRFIKYVLTDDPEWDVLVFLTRKGYWLYRMFCWYLDISLNLDSGRIICNDRKIDKGDIEELKEAISESGEENPVVYIIDDTLYTGSTAYRVFQIFQNEWPEAEIVPIACFLSRTFEDLIDSPDYIVDESFLDAFRYFYKATPSELGSLSYHQAKVAQYEMIQYVVDLPFLVDESYDSADLVHCFSKRYGDDQNRRFSILSDAVFHSMIHENRAWRYVDNSYFIDTRSKIHTGFFIYNGNELGRIFSNRLFNNIVKCRYERMERNRVAVIFTPFAMIKTSGFDELWDIFTAIYGMEDRDYQNVFHQYYDYILNKKNQKGEENVALAVLRSIIYFMSYYLGYLFIDWTKNYSVDLIVDDSFMKESSGQSFIEVESRLKCFSKDDYYNVFNRINELSFSRSIVNRRSAYIDINNEEDLDEAAYCAVFFEMLARKREDKKDGCFTIEDMEAILGSLRIFNSYWDLRECLTKILLRMLDTSVIGNRVWYRNGTVYRGFRYGENSDIILPFFNPYLFFGIDLFYRKLAWYGEDQEEFLFHHNIERLIDQIADMMRRKGYMGYVVTETEVKYHKIYFSADEELDTLLVNKRFYLQEEDTNSIAFQEVKRVIDNFELVS